MSFLPDLMVPPVDLHVAMKTIANGVHERVQEVLLGLGMHGEIKLCMTIHKKTEVEIGAQRFVITQCASDRVAWVVTFTPEEAKTKPIQLFKIYNAQGLAQDHPLQHVLLARCRHFAVAQCVTKAFAEHLPNNRRPKIRVQPLKAQSEDGELMM